ncbi:Zn(2)-C6 fungal-type domain-containing protein [Mycena venus]|uniref:Oxidation resistance protein 1 n=1 Tax=Mycena venus TaxID=2733690 RepID=A0A8H7DF13_9AGAR|nr:Zn(2)-C6 fungal-type domain-containing protein [Mycena venus]
MSDSLIDSIPVLVPVPASSKPTTPTPPTKKTRAELDREAEEAFDKFSTLFSPATPRASPILDPLSLPVQTQSKKFAAEMSPDSEFGSFVSVPAAQDPLSLMTPGLDLDTPMQPEGRPGQPRNPSQTFFEEFSKSAKDRTETKRGLLDELLMHEDDPLYWIKDQSASTSSPPPEPEEELLPSQKPNKYMTDSLSDLDFEFFSSGQLTTTPHRRSSSTSSHLRSPTATAAPTIAPPLASTSTSADAPGFDFPSHASRVHAPARSSSYASLASLSKGSGAKWVASFLPTALSAPSASVPNTNFLPQSPTASPSPSLSNSLTLPPQHQHHAPVGPPARVPEISHFTPFGAKDATVYVAPTGAPGFRGTASYDWDRGFSHALERDLGVAPPDGGHAAVVPYSDFEEGEELIGVNANDPSRRPSPANGNGNGNGNGAGAKKEGVGVLLDKKASGVISLIGRREGTVGVLTPELVALVSRLVSACMELPYFLFLASTLTSPALLRLPRQWTLFYSLDQHGISLNTLYSRCGPPSSSRTPHAKGALVVIQDAGGVLFGAWVADGLKRSTRGGYYGGGESFLWRYLPTSGKFDVYKWTGKNDYVALCEDGFISFGGGDGHYGLYLDDSLFDGSSARCPTFENEPLCSGAVGKGGNVNFECVGLEVWGVGP